MLYFAYGSNCNPAVMDRKNVRFLSRKRAILRGFRLLFNKKSLREHLPRTIGFANINVDPESAVEGILYEIDPRDVELLDQSERYPEHYGRIEVMVETDDGAVHCQAYQAQPDKISEGLTPSRNYLNHLLAAKDFLSEQYYQALDQSQTYHGECYCCQQTIEVFFLKEAETMYMLCQACREARLVWGDARGRGFTVIETQAVMRELVSEEAGFSSVHQLVEEAIKRRLIDP